LSALVSQYPADSIGLGNLALAYFYQRSMRQSLEEQRLALDLSPRSVLQRSNFAMYALYSGDFDAAAKESQAMLAENPKFDQALRTQALAELGRGRNEEARQAYEKVKDVSTYGASISRIGLADLALYEAASLMLWAFSKKRRANTNQPTTRNRLPISEPLWP